MTPSPELLTAVRYVLADGRAHTGADLARAIGVTRLRSIGEAIAVLIEQGVPIASLSADGYRLATSAEELERALAEVERRARRTLMRRRYLRKALLSLRGQLRLGGVA